MHSWARLVCFPIRWSALDSKRRDHHLVKQLILHRNQKCEIQFSVKVKQQDIRGVIFILLQRPAASNCNYEMNEPNLISSHTANGPL